MAKKLITLVGVVVMIAAMLVLGCAPKAAPPAGEEQPAKPVEPIKIGLIAALSAPYGLSDLAAVEIGVEDVNKAGGIMGRPIKLISEDWKREVPLAVSAYKKLVMTDKCLAVITEGTEGSIACREAAAELYPEYPHLMFAIWTATDEVTKDTVGKDYEKYKFLFRPYTISGGVYNVALPDPYWEGWNMLGTDLALVIEDIGWTQVYIKGSDEFPTVKDYLESHGMNIVYTAENAIDEKMFLPIFEEIAKSGAEGIVWITGYTDGTTLVKQWSQSAAKDLNLYTMSGAGCYAAFWDMTAGACLGLVVDFPEVRAPVTELTLPFLDALKEKEAGLLASSFGAHDIPLILKAAIEKVGGTEDVNALIKAVEGNEVLGTRGIWKFDETHDTVIGTPYYETYWAQWQEDGKFVVVWPETVRELSNPNDHFIPVKELIAK